MTDIIGMLRQGTWNGYSSSAELTISISFLSKAPSYYNEKNMNDYLYPAPPPPTGTQILQEIHPTSVQINGNIFNAFDDAFKTWSDVANIHIKDSSITKDDPTAVGYVRWVAWFCLLCRLC